MKTILVILTAGAALFAQTPAAKKAPAKTTPGKTGTAKTTAAARPNRALLNPAALKAKAPELFKAKFTTTKGDFVVEVHRAWAPVGADRFYNLVKNGFFSDAAFFRVMPGFIVQFGLGPSPAINKAWERAKIPDDPVKETNRKGYLTFATAGPNTRTTQLFINLGDNAGLDPQGFAPFGMVVEGMDVVEKINPEYREQPAQDRITNEGKPYLEKSFPNIDYIKSAQITEPAGTAPASKPATGAPKKTLPVKPATK